MTTDLIGHASGFEILFFISALVGAWLSSQNFTEALADLRALGGATNGRRMVALSRIRTELILGVVYLLYIIAGLYAISQPPPPVITHPLVQAIFVLSSWGLTAISYMSRSVGKYLMEHGFQARDSTGRFIKATDTEGADIAEQSHDRRI